MRQFYGHLEKMRSFCRKNHVRKIPLFWGGVLGGGGGGADFIFMGARIFLNPFAEISPGVKDMALRKGLRGAIRKIWVTRAL